jgi:hypothetical protein
MTDQELLQEAEAAKGEFTRRIRTMADFRYDEQQCKFWDTTTGILLEARSVDGAIPARLWPEVKGKKEDEPKKIQPSFAINDVDTGLTVEGSTWWPGQPRFIENIVVSERGAMPMKGAVCYNSYLPPIVDYSEAKESPEPWIEHVKKLYPDTIEHEHFFDFCAHMLQRPDEKINHGIVMAGAQGIGKDTALIPVRRGVGEWNAAEVGPDAITSAYNGYIKSVLLVINEVRPQDEDFKATNFYNLLKPILAAPPDMLPMTLKYANTIYVRNLCHVILTTNDPLTMYIPPEDRRLFVMNSPLDSPGKGGWDADYFEKLYTYLDGGGALAAAKWLSERKYSAANLRAQPPQSKGKSSIIESAVQVRRTAIDDIFEDYSGEEVDGKPRGRPAVIFPSDIAAFVLRAQTFDDEAKILGQIKAKNFHFKMAEHGYSLMRNPKATEWRCGKYRSRIAFVEKSVPEGDRVQLIEDALAARAEEA